MNKVWLALSAFLLAFSISSLAQQLVFNPVFNDVTYVATLNHFKLDPLSTLPTAVRSGYVQIRLVNNQAQSISVTLYPQSLCPVKDVCVMMLPPPVISQVPVNSYSINSCGIKTYSGVTDARRTDGALIKVTVIDNTSNVCPTFAILSPTEVVYESMGTESHQLSHSVMAGGRLEVQNALL